MAGYNLKEVSILVIDDSSHMRALLRTMLCSLGLKRKKIYDVDSVAKAIDLLKLTDVDIIICDWKMEPINGMDFVQKLRAFPVGDKPNPFIPVILLTAHAEMEAVRLARDIGVNEFLVKPIAPKDLYARIKAIIECPRLFVRTNTYSGPDRRRQDVPIDFKDKRKGKVK